MNVMNSDNSIIYIAFLLCFVVVLVVMRHLALSNNILLDF